MDTEIKAIIEKLKTFSTPELCDGAEDPQTMDYQIRQLVGDGQMVGKAYPIQVPYGISGIIPDGILEAPEGSVLVIAGGGFCRGSFWGDHRSICAAKKGLAGVVIDGAFRDLEGCREAGVPIFARAVVPRSAGKEQKGELNVPVICGGVEVHPGDYVIGDCNGVLVLKPEELEDVFRRSEEKIRAQEATIRQMEETGEILPRVIRK